VAERSAALLAASGAGDMSADPFSLVTLDGDALSDPSRLAEEAWTVPLFGGRRTIRVTATTRNIAPAVEPLLRDPPTDAFIVIEAGDLKPSAPLRKAVERSDTAVALACYSDDVG